MEDFALVFAAATAVNRFIEFIKPRVDALKLTDSTRDGVLVLIAALTGILIALLSGGAINIFATVYGLPPLAGQILTGVLTGLGADVLNAVIGVLYGWRDRATPTSKL